MPIVDEFVISDFMFVSNERPCSSGAVIRHGIDLVREIRKLIPKQKMAIMSGEANTAQEVLDPSVKDAPILSKPFRFKHIDELLQKA